MESVPGRYEFLPHTADAKFRAFGQSMEEMFMNAAVATFAIITNPTIVKEKLEFPLEIRAKTHEALLFDFLDELLFLLDTEGFLLHQCKDLVIKRGNEPDGSLLFQLTCVAVGDYHKGYDVSCNVKAVTYNDMYVKDEGGKWECQVVVDL